MLMLTLVHFFLSLKPSIIATKIVIKAFVKSASETELIERVDRFCNIEHERATNYFQLFMNQFLNFVHNSMSMFVIRSELKEILVIPPAQNLCQTGTLQLGATLISSHQTTNLQT